MKKLKYRLLMVGRLLFLVGILIVFHAKAQPDTLRLSEFKEHRMLFEKAVFTTTPLREKRQISPQFFTNQFSNWQPLTPQSPTYTDRTHWLHFRVHNDTDTAQTIYINVHSANQIVVFYVAYNGQISALRSGYMTPSSQWALPADDRYIPLIFPKGATFDLLAQLSNYAGILPFWTGIQSPKPSFRLQLEKESFYLKKTLNEYRRNLPEFQYRSWIQGALALAVLFVGLLYLKYRQRIYAYYWAYNLCGFLFSLLKTRAYTPIGQSLGEWPLLKSHLMESLLWWGIGAYLLFMTELLDLAKTHPLMRRWFRRLAILLGGYGFVYITVMLLTNDGGFQQFSFWVGRFIALPIYIFTLIWMSRSVRSPMVPFVIWANSMLGLFGILAWLRAGEVILKGVKLPANVDDLLTLSFAVVAEIIVLSLALAHRYRLLEKEKTESQLAYYEELQNKSFYEKRMAETEMLALRSQMNPHFLFNSLNSLEYLILSNDEHKATGYLAKFSKLLRMILNHSREESILLEEELTALRYYLDIEATRLGEGFTYSIEVADSVDTQRLIIPPLLLQPFVENAIWHGLMPSDKLPKNLRIRVRLADAHRVEFEIEDNGIGRKKSAEMRSRSSVKRKSYGMDITQQRIALFNRNYPNQLSIEVNDLQREKETGTLVRIVYNLLDEPTNET
ncbi:histidine kinase [Runella aurantiaca]|uniref:histidine kinase n=1 Tax=Runella aurantiaca TaxID=2282308 RepID=UPI001314DC6D|nr:histidine kinase [Runella aurantiaca]